MKPSIPLRALLIALAVSLIFYGCGYLLVSIVTGQR